MKYRTGTFGGSLVGTTGFALMFTWLVIDVTPPSDELAPGMVVILSVVNGMIYALAGRWIQERIGLRTHAQESGK